MKPLVFIMFPERLFSNSWLVPIFHSLFLVVDVLGQSWSTLLHCCHVQQCSFIRAHRQGLLSARCSWARPAALSRRAGQPRAGLGRVCQLCHSWSRAVHSLPHPALCDSGPAQPSQQSVSPGRWPSPSQLHGHTTSPTALAPLLSPAAGNLPSSSTHWVSSLQELTAQHPPRGLAHLWGAKAKPKSPPAFYEISLLAFHSSASHMHPDGLALTCYKTWELERSVDVDLPTGDFLPPSKLVHDYPRAENKRIFLLLIILKWPLRKSISFSTAEGKVASLR